jgi:hypothetical protein
VRPEPPLSVLAHDPAFGAPPERSRERARAAAEVLRARRARAFRPSFYQVYFTLVATAIYGALAGNAISGAVGPGLSERTLNVWGPAVLIVGLLTALRLGTWQGPVVFSQADVAFVLSAPIALADLVRPRLAQAFAVATVSGALVGVLALLASAAGLGGVGGARLAGAVVAFAALGLIAVAASWLVERSLAWTRVVLRAGPLVIVLAAGLPAVAELGAGGRALAIWSGPWGWALAPLCGVSGWPLAVGLNALAALTAIAFALRYANSAPTECFLAQAETRSRLAAAAITLDYRSAGLAHQSATGRGAAGLAGWWLRLRPRRPRRRGHVVAWRDALALLRAPSRLAWAATLCAAGTLEAISHPGRPLPAALAAIAMYFAAAALLEPLRVEVDAPDKSRLLLCWRFARVLVAHCVLPVITLVIVASVTIAVTVCVGGAGVGALAVIPTLLTPLLCCAVLCAALAARSGGRIGESVLQRVLTSAASDPFGGISAVLWVAPWLLLEIVVVALPILLLGHAAAHHRPVLRAGLWAGSISIAVASFLHTTASRSGAPDDAPSSTL